MDLCLYLTCTILLPNGNIQIQIQERFFCVASLDFSVASSLRKTPEEVIVGHVKFSPNDYQEKSNLLPSHEPCRKHSTQYLWIP